MSAADPSQAGGLTPAEKGIESSLPPAVIAGFSAWLLDAFDFFRVTFCLTAMGHDFHKSDAEISLIITMTMAFRPVGGLIFGLLADRYGRRIPLMINTGYFFLIDRLGWRPLFYLGSLPAIALVLYIKLRVKESEVWKREFKSRQPWPEQRREILSHWRLFLYLLAFMTMMLFASHGTQDMYPTLLQRQWHFAPPQRATITAISGIGAIIGGLVFGHLSDKWGRRKAIVLAFVLASILIPLWAYAPNTILLVVGAFLMQFMVQGAWGVIPAHLAELSPDSVRALLPGFAYQSAGIIASSVVYIEAVYAQKTSYATAMALTAISVFVLASVMALLGRERHGQKFGV